MKRLLVGLLVVAVVLVVFVTRETAESYCRDNFKDYGGDYQTCVNWYRDNQPRPGER